MDEQELVEIQKRAESLPPPNRADVLKLIYEFRLLKAKSEQIHLSPDELAFIIRNYEQREKNLRRSLQRLVENLDHPVRKNL